MNSTDHLTNTQRPLGVEPTQEGLCRSVPPLDHSRRDSNAVAGRTKAVSQSSSLWQRSLWRQMGSTATGLDGRWARRPLGSPTGLDGRCGSLP
jgi:hypothetical protein